MTALYDILTTIQTEAVAALREDSALASVDIIGEDRKDIINAIQIAVKKLGVCLVVSTAQANTSTPNVPGPRFDQIEFQVDSTELVIVNRGASGSGLTALDSACRVAAALHHFRPSCGGGCVYMTNPGIQHIPDSTFLIYRTHFRIGT